MLNSAPIKIKCNRLLMLGSLLACILMTGCTLTPTVANIEIPEVANPKSGPAVRIVSVEDRREFGPFVSGSYTQQSVDGDHLNKRLTERVIARQGIKFARANVLLPDGQTVSSKISEVVRNALKSSGYRILSDAHSDGASIEVQVVIDRSWANIVEQVGMTGLHQRASQLINIRLGRSEVIVDAPYDVVSDGLLQYVTPQQVYQSSLIELQKRIILALNLEQRKSVQINSF